MVQKILEFKIDNEVQKTRHLRSHFGWISSELHTIYQTELHDLVRDINLSKNHAELLAFRLKDNLLEKEE